MNELIALERNGSIATVVLNRPDKLNALTKPMWRRWEKRSKRCRPTTACAA